MLSQIIQFLNNFQNLHKAKVGKHTVDFKVALSETTLKPITEGRVVTETIG